MNGETTGLVLGSVGGLWTVGYLFHLWPLKESTAWWSIPWCVSVMCLGGLVVAVCYAVGLRFDWRAHKRKNSLRR